MAAALKMECKSVDAELDRQFGKPGQPLSPTARQHLDECERCTNLYRYLTQPAPAWSVSPELEQKISKNAKGSLQPVSRLRSTSVRAAQLLIVFVLLAAAVTSMMKILGIEAMSRAQLAGISAVLALGVVLLTRSLAWQMTPGSLQRIPAWSAVAIVGAGLLAGTVILFPWQTPEEFIEHGWRCLRTGLTLAVPTAALFWLSVRRGAFVNLTTLGATLGAIAGLLSVTVLQFTCNMQEIAHLLVWHGGVLAISTVIGALIGGSVARLRLASLK